MSTKSPCGYLGYYINRFSNVIINDHEMFAEKTIFANSPLILRGGSHGDRPEGAGTDRHAPRAL
jgi:hypothetical protein